MGCQPAIAAQAQPAAGSSGARARQGTRRGARRKRWGGVGEERADAAVLVVARQNVTAELVEKKDELVEKKDAKLVTEEKHDTVANFINILIGLYLNNIFLNKNI